MLASEPPRIALDKKETHEKKEGLKTIKKSLVKGCLHHRYRESTAINDRRTYSMLHHGHMRLDEERLQAYRGTNAARDGNSTFLSRVLSRLGMRD